MSLEPRGKQRALAQRSVLHRGGKERLRVDLFPEVKSVNVLLVEAAGDAKFGQPWLPPVGGDKVKVQLIIGHNDLST